MKERLKAWGDSQIVQIVGVFAFDPGGDLLLLQRHSDDLGGGQWGTPGGRIESGESPLKAMQRELKEETGLSGFRLAELGKHYIHMPHGTVHMTSYRATIPKNAVIKLDPVEHHAYAWFAPAGLLDEDNILWGIPTILNDFGLLPDFDVDPTLADGSRAELITKK